MTIYRFFFSVLVPIIFAIFVMGCGDSTDTRVVDPRTGQLTQALSISFQNDPRSKAESETTPIGPVTIANLTSSVELFEISIETSDPVAKILMDTYNGVSTTRVGESRPVAPTTTHLIKADNSGFLHTFINDGEEVKAYFYVDTRGLAGESITLRINSVKVKVNGGNEMQLSAQNRSTTFFVQEPAKVKVTQGQTNTSFTSAGTNDLWQNFVVTNESQTFNMYAQHFYVNANVNNLTLTLNDHQGNLIGTFTNNGNGLYYLSSQVGSLTQLQINAGTTHAYQIRGNPNGNKAIQLTSLQVDAFSGSQLTGTDSVNLSRTITYP